MRILIVTEYYWPHIGGVEVLFKNLAEGLVQKGHRVHVVTSRVSKTVRHEKLNGVEIHRVFVPQKGDRYFFTFLSLFKIWHLAGQTDLIHSTLYNAAIPSWIVSKLRRKKAILTVHEVFGKKWTTRFETSYFFATTHRLLEKMILKFRFPIYICVSKSTARDLAPYILRKSSTKVIYNGLDEIVFDPQKYKIEKDEEFTFLFYGRPGISKGADVLVKAAALVKKELPKSRLKMILAGEPAGGYKKVKNLIKSQNLEGYIDLLKPVPYKELPLHLARSHVAIVPSLAEGFGFTAAESCAMNIPIVVSETASLPEVVSGKVIFVKPGDVNDLARGMVLAYRGKFKNIPKKTFSWIKNVTEHIETYQSILEEKKINKKENLKVAMLIDAWFPLHGGGQVHAKKLTEGLIPYGVKTDLFTRNLKDEKGKCLERHEKGIPNVFRLGHCSEFYNLWGRISWLWKVYFVVKKSHKKSPYDLIHAHAFLAGLPGKLLSWRLKIPIVYTVHGTSLFYNQRGFIPWVERFLVSKIRYNQEISVAHNFLRLPNKNKNIAIIQNGVDLEPFQKIQPKKHDIFTLLFVGRLDPIKGLNFLIKALSDWDYKNKPLALRVIGDGPARRDLELQGKENQHIQFLGKITGDAVIKEYKKAHLFVLPSLSEGQPLTVLESFAAECPVLATKVGDNELFIEDRGSGFLVPSQDVAALRDAIKKAYDLFKNNPTKYKQMGQRGYAKIKKEYTWEKTATQTFELYQKLIS